jgi:hypothetical protein
MLERPVFSCTRLPQSLVWLSIFALLPIAPGCAEQQPPPVFLQYEALEREKLTNSLSGSTIGIVPLRDQRTDPCVLRFFNEPSFLADSEDPGIWVANAIRLELEREGATVIAFPAGTAPTSGLVLTGQVNILAGSGTMWITPIPIVPSLEEYRPQINAMITVFDEGIPVFSRLYNIKTKEVYAPALQGQISDYGAHALGQALRKLVCGQVLPDLEQVLRSAQSVPTKTQTPELENQ